eukprot:1602841-Lingulodinium_polyedra.AAC.1
MPMGLKPSSFGSSTTSKKRSDSGSLPSTSWSTSRSARTSSAPSDMSWKCRMAKSAGAAAVAWLKEPAASRSCAGVRNADTALPSRSGSSGA